MACKLIENKNWLILLLSVIIIMLLIIVIGKVSKKEDTNITANIILPNNNLQDVNLELPQNKLIDDDAIKGDPDAPITIIEFSDYECSFCQRFYYETLPQIQSEYIDKGLVKLVYRDFPISNHKYAQVSAEAAECAGEQGKYYEMHNLLFEKGVSGGTTSYKRFAKDIGLNTEQFNSCLDNRDQKAEVLNDFKVGQTEGVTGTPAFVINGELIIGAQPFEVFKEVIDRQLAQIQ
ncbi:MAG: DsbA family protein [archaeon]|jgi:protein-disulfide isomerase|nr:DsbA family protein [archaeon]MDD3085180.1 DsbA family protein [Candidatus ainarchaeum sp.]MDD4220816.1 DsbA family protein [Candidatus ainarchaeum sp.]MDD4662316.1 DsbA family protein [Candidatus ainarchaeum sp.]